MTKAKKIRLYYGIFLAVFTVVVGALFIFQAADIYYSAPEGQHAYTREDVAHRLSLLMIPVGIWIGSIVAGFVLSVVYQEKSDKKIRRSNSQIVARLSKRIQATESQTYQQYKKWDIARLATYAVCAAFTLVATVFCCVYLFNTANFPGNVQNLNKEILKMLRNVLCWMSAALLLFVVAVILDNFLFSKKQLPLAKQLIAENPSAQPKQPNAKWAAFKKAMGCNLTKWIVRGIVLAVAVTFIILGIFNDGAHSVLVKATAICTECIGLG